MRAHPTEHAVTALMAVGVVDPPEVVDIHHERRQGAAVAAAALAPEDDKALELPAVLDYY